jgi:VPS33B-interacting protein in polarity and apical restriction
MDNAEDFDYWNSSSKSFSFDDEIEDNIINNDEKSESEISAQSSVLSLNFIINEADLQSILEEEQQLNSEIIPKGLTVEEEIKYLRRKFNEFIYSSANLTITKLLLQKNCSLECYKKLSEKEELLDEAIKSGNGDAIIKVVLFLKNTLKPVLFLKLIGNRNEAINHYINYLITTMKIGEAYDILSMLDRNQEAALLQFSTIAQSKNSIQKLDKLKKIQELFNQPSSNPFLLSQLKSYINLLEFQVNERIYFQPHDVIDKSVIETLHFTCHKFQKWSDPSSQASLSNPYKMCEEFSINAAQFEWIAVNQRAKVQAWRDVESLFEKKSAVLKKKQFVINIPLEVVILKLFHLKAPQAVLNSFLQHVEDPERRLILAKKVHAINSIIDSLAALKDKKALEEFKETLASGTAEFFHSEKALTSLLANKSFLGTNKK